MRVCAETPLPVLCSVCRGQHNPNRLSADTAVVLFACARLFKDNFERSNRVRSGYVDAKDKRFTPAPARIFKNMVL